MDRTWCSNVMRQAFPALKDNARRSEKQKENLSDMQILMSSAAKVWGVAVFACHACLLPPPSTRELLTARVQVFLAELIETARAVQVRSARTNRQLVFIRSPLQAAARRSLRRVTLVCSTKRIL